MQARRRDRSGESGQALLELALVAPLLVLFVMAIFQFAYVLETQMGLTNAVREAARRAAATTNPTDVWVQRELCGIDLVACDTGLLHDNVQGFQGALLPAAPSVAFCVYDVGGTPNFQVHVLVTYKHPVFFGPIAFATDFMDGIHDSRWQLTADAQMRLERGEPTVTPTDICPS